MDHPNTLQLSLSIPLVFLGFFIFFITFGYYTSIFLFIHAELWMLVEADATDVIFHGN